MKRRLALFVRDKHGCEWSFEIHEDPAHLAEWRAAGLEVNEIVASVPVWAAYLGLTRVWVFAQVAWQWLRIF